MLGIIKRDLTLILTGKDTIFMLLFYAPLLIYIVDSYTPDFMYLVILIAYTYMMLINSFSYDISGKFKYIMASLPMTRVQFVVYKYISTFIYFALVLVFIGVYLWIINTLNFASVDYFNFDMIKIAIPSIMIFVAIVFPAYFIFDPKIARIIQIVVFLTFFITVSNIAFTGDKGILRYIVNLQWGLVVLIAIVLYILSILISVKVYNNKDL